jgi:starch-binding outer membrane protein, SusD/RagB family
VKAFNDPNDKRFNITVDTLGGFYNSSGVFTKFIQAATYTKKFLVPITVSSDSPVNWKYLRYADVLLMYAEVLNENNKTEQALNYLNQIRRRAGAFEYGVLSQNETREMIYLERRLELSFEGHRWFDLVRTGKALEACQSEGMKDYMTLFPVPLVQIQVMNDPTLFPQNPGYD